MAVERAVDRSVSVSVSVAVSREDVDKALVRAVVATELRVLSRTDDVSKSESVVLWALAKAARPARRMN